MYTQGTRIRYARENLKLSQQQLGDLVPCDQQSIWRYENDEGNPRPKRLALIAKALGCSPLWLKHGSHDSIALPEEMQGNLDQQLLIENKLKRRMVPLIPFALAHKPQKNDNLTQLYRLSLPPNLDVFFNPTDQCFTTQYTGRQVEFPQNNHDIIYQGNYLTIEPLLHPQPGDLVLYRQNIRAEDGKKEEEVNFILEYLPPVPEYLKKIGVILVVHKILR